MPYNTLYIWSPYETLGSTNLNANMANLDYLKNKADQMIRSCLVFYQTQSLSTGDGKYGFSVPIWLNGYDVAGVWAHVWTVSSSGVITAQLRNATQGFDVLSTALTIDENEHNSSDAATPAVINTSNDNLTTGDEMYIDMDGIGTGAKGFEFQIRAYLT